MSKPADGYLPERSHPSSFGAALIAFFVTVLSIGLIGSFFDRTDLAGENRRPAALPGAPSSTKVWLVFPGSSEDTSTINSDCGIACWESITE